MRNPESYPLVLIDLQLPADDARTVRDAFDWAAAEHAGQVRKDGSRLIDHVIGVARNVRRFSSGPDVTELITAALLHDIVENTPVSLSEVEDRFGPTVAQLVDAVTNRDHETTADSACRARDEGRDALLLRLCDRLDGIRRSPGRPESNRRKFLRLSREVHLPLAETHFADLAGAMRVALDEAEAASTGS